VSSLDQVAVLFARRDSIYKTLPSCDVWDEDRNALNWHGGCPIIAHPPCRAWGQLRSFANPVPGEKELEVWAIDQVRKYGGVLEHPYKSTLWRHCNLPLDTIDRFGGWTLSAPQWWWNHPAEKATWFYICGIRPGSVPEIPLRLGEAEFVVQSRKRSGYRKHISKADRDRTPRDAAIWLCALARKARAG
jgi:hypothetical protein